MGLEGWPYARMVAGVHISWTDATGFQSQFLRKMGEMNGTAARDRDVTEHDVTRPRWGHNVEITMWDREASKAAGVCWLTPAPRNGDILIIAGKKGAIRIKVYDIEWVTGVDDMYRFKAVPEGAPIPEQKGTEE